MRIGFYFPKTFCLEQPTNTKKEFELLLLPESPSSKTDPVRRVSITESDDEIDTDDITAHIKNKIVPGEFIVQKTFVRAVIKIFQSENSFDFSYTNYLHIQNWV